MPLRLKIWRARDRDFCTRETGRVNAGRVEPIRTWMYATLRQGYDAGLQFPVDVVSIRIG